MPSPRWLNQIIYFMTTMEQKTYKYYDLIMVLFVTVLILSNITSSAKIVDWGISLFGVRLAFDAGTILFPLSYIFGDILTEVYGYRRSRRVIWAGFACLPFSSVVFLHGKGSGRSHVGKVCRPKRIQCHPAGDDIGGYCSGKSSRLLDG